MPFLNMYGPYEFTKEMVDRKITKKSAGNYALGYLRNDVFVVRYVGRSDSDVNGRIKDHIGECDEYQMFKFSYATSPRAAFLEECRNWHDFQGPSGKLNNEYHPDKPKGTHWVCPECGK